MQLFYSLLIVCSLPNGTECSSDLLDSKHYFLSWILNSFPLICIVRLCVGRRKWKERWMTTVSLKWCYKNQQNKVSIMGWNWYSLMCKGWKTVLFWVHLTLRAESLEDYCSFHVYFKNALRPLGSNVLYHNIQSVNTARATFQSSVYFLDLCLLYKIFNALQQTYMHGKNFRSSVFIQKYLQVLYDLHRL